ncbi:MAG: PA0069 family radical SAM protein [Vicinamibacteraceae bacterium]
MTPADTAGAGLPGRGTAAQPANRFDRLHVAIEPDDEAEAVCDSDGDGRDRTVRTEFFRDHSRTVISTNDSPDIPFSASLNPYRGCEHGCIYCYARPTHEFLGLSAGLDFETRIFVKEDAPELLRAALSAPAWEPKVLAMSGVTDCYQPVERTLRLTRRCLEVLAEFRNPVGIVTKNALVARDADVLADLASDRCANVALSVTTLDEHLRRALEPRTSTADLRLEAVAKLNAAGVPAGVMIAPVIPGLNDHEIPAILARAAQAGARFAGYTMLRLPFAVKGLFDEWLTRHAPDRRAHVLSRIQDVRGGKLNDAQFGSRMTGAGPSAELIATLFKTARARAGIPSSGPPLRVDAFRRKGQLDLF